MAFRHHLFIRTLLAAVPLPAVLSGLPAAQATSALAPLAELRKSFTVQGKPVPPEIFRDMGDGDLADSDSIRVTVDVRAAIGSNLYADEITQKDGWVRQIKQADKAGGLGEETSYRFIGATQNNLLVAVAAYNGGGSGTFYTLHILDAQAARGFTPEGKLYDRLNVTALRSVALGDRWDGTVTITGNVIAITTPAGARQQDGKPLMQTIKAERP